MATGHSDRALLAMVIVGFAASYTPACGRPAKY
jgi:hypothetical protein